MDEKNIMMNTNWAVKIAKSIILFGVTFVYVTPLFFVFYSIIFYSNDLFSLHSIKCYILSYLIGFVIFLDRMVSLKKMAEKD